MFFTVFFQKKQTVFFWCVCVFLLNVFFFLMCVVRSSYVFLLLLVG